MPLLSMPTPSSAIRLQLLGSVVLMRSTGSAPRPCGQLGRACGR